MFAVFQIYIQQIQKRFYFKNPQSKLQNPKYETQQTFTHSTRFNGKDK